MSERSRSVTWISWDEVQGPGPNLGIASNCNTSPTTEYNLVLNAYLTPDQFHVILHLRPHLWSRAQSYANCWQRVTFQLGWVILCFQTEYSLRLQGAHFLPGTSNCVLQTCIFVVRAHSRRLGIWMLSTITGITVCHRWVTSLQLQFGWLPCFHFSWNVAFSSCKDDDLSTQAVPFSPSLDELKTHRCGSLRALKADIWRLERLPLPLPTPAGCVARRDISDLDSYQYHPTHAQTLSAASVLPAILCTQTLVIKWC